MTRNLEATRSGLPFQLSMGKTGVPYWHRPAVGLARTRPLLAAPPVEPPTTPRHVNALPFHRDHICPTEGLHVSRL